MTELESVSRNVEKAVEQLKREIKILSELAIEQDKNWQRNSEQLHKDNQRLKESLRICEQQRRR